MRFAIPSENHSHVAGNLWLVKTDIPEGQLALIKQALTRPSAAGYATRFWSETPSHLIVPRSFTWPGVRVPTIDLSGHGQPLPRFKDSVTRFLSPEQEAAWNAFRDAQGGILSLPGGLGKTVLAAKKICHEAVTAAVVAPPYLIDQWINELHVRGGIPIEDIGLVQGSKLQTDRPVVVCSYDTLRSIPYAVPPEFRDRFGLVIFDECHMLGAPAQSQLASLFRCRRFGVSATPDGSDNRDVLISWMLGPVFFESFVQRLKPRVIVKSLPRWPLEGVSLKARYVAALDWTKMWRLLGEDKATNDIILEDLRFYLAQNRSIVAFTNRVDHLMRISAEFPGCGVICRETPKRERKEHWTRNPVFAVPQLGAVGVNKPELDTLYLIQPVGASATVRQEFFRILRDIVEKPNPLVVVLAYPFGPCQALANKIVGIAKERGYDVEYQRMEGKMVDMLDVPSPEGNVGGDMRRRWGSRFPADRRLS